MKKLLLLTLLQLCLCNLFAQTDVSTALELKPGTNNYDLSGESGYVSLYYKYVVPEESDQLISITTTQGTGLSYMMSEDGTYNTMIMGVNTSEGSYFPVEKGKTVYLTVNAYAGGSIAFDMKAENAVVKGGATKDDAIDVTGKSDFLVPSNYSTQTYQSVTYLKYTCNDPEDGLLVMNFTGSVSSLMIGEEGSDAESSVTVNYVNGGVQGKAQVEAGKTYVITVMTYSSSPVMANMYSSLASGTKEVKAEVSAGNTYIICWNLDEDINGFKYNVSADDIAQGDVYSNPIPAVVGTNDINGGGDKFYKYTATIDGWLMITPSDPITKVQFPVESGSYVSYLTAIQDGFAVKTEIAKGKEYVIQFSNISEDGTFDLEEVPYAEGESQGTAIEVEGNSANVPETAQTTWFKYVAPADGMLEISSNIYYEHNASYESSTVRVLREGDSMPVDITTSNSEETMFFGKFGAKQGDVFYVQVVTLSAQKGKKVTFNLRDYEPGESSDNPIELVVGENQLKEATRQNPIWYYADLAEGDLKITADANNYYIMSLYSADDLTKSLALSSYVYDENYNGSYDLTYTVETPGRYIMKLEQTYPGGALVTMSANIATGISETGFDAESVIVGSGCITVTPAAGANVSVYDLSGKMVKSAYVKGQTTFNVEKGLYIVRVNNKAIKVVVKD